MRELQIAGDPSRWIIPGSFDPQQLTASGKPISVQVTSPLRGNLLLSPKAASIAAFDPGPVGWEPGHIQLPGAVLYLPSPAGPTASDHGYTLPPGTDLADLADKITTAMTAGTDLPVQISAGMGGVVVLNAALLSFAVLCPAAAGGPVT